MSIKRTWKSRTSVFWGLVFIGAAVLLILNGIGVNLGYGISVWKIILGVICLAWLVDTLVERRFTEIAFPLAFLFLIFESTIAHAIGRTDGNLISDWTVILAALLVTIGLKALIPDRGGRKFLGKSGSTSIYLDASDLSDAEIRDNAGSVQAHITNREAYRGDGVITIRDNLGKVDLYLPSNWNIVVNCRDNLGKVNVPDQDDGVFDKSITIEVRDNIGSVNVKYD